MAMSSTYPEDIRYLSTSDVAGLALSLLGYDEEALSLALRRTANPNPDERRIHDDAALLLESLLTFSPFTLHLEDIARRAACRFYELNGWTLADHHADVRALVGDLVSGRVTSTRAALVLSRHAARSPA
jgi:hypothetical protein